MKNYEDDVEKREDIKWGLKRTRITPEEAIDALRMMGYSESRAIALVDKWAPDKYEPHAVWSKIKPRKLVREMAWRDGRKQFKSNREWEVNYIPDLDLVEVFLDNEKVYKVSDIYWTSEDFKELAVELGSSVQSGTNGDYKAWVIMTKQDPVELLKEMVEPFLRNG